MIGPVVVGVDGSSSSMAAVEVAAREAGLRGVGLRLVHAFGRPGAHIPPGGRPWEPSSAAGLRELIDGTLTRAQQRAHETGPGVDITREVVVGEPITVLEIESRTASLAVVGSRGLSRFGALMLGSTAGHMAAHAACPVLVVRRRPTRPGLSSWPSTARPRRAARSSTPSPTPPCTAYGWRRCTPGACGTSARTAPPPTRPS